MKNIVFAFLGLCLFGLTSCTNDPDAPPAATPSTPQITAGMGLTNSLYNNLPNRNDPCAWFDGDQNKATQVTIETFTLDSQGKMIKLYDPQIFLDGRDFYGGDPGGLHFKAPEKGGFLMVVSVYAEPNEDCCPGPPPGRPVYREIWPWVEIDRGYPVVVNLPHFTGECLYF